MPNSTPTNRATTTTTSDAAFDELESLDEFLEEFTRDPRNHAAYEDAEIRADLVRALIRRRKDKRLTQRQVAELMETSQSAVSELEGGGTDPRLSTLQRYARAVDAKLHPRLWDHEWIPTGSDGGQQCVVVHFTPRWQRVRAAHG